MQTTDRAKVSPIFLSGRKSLLPQRGRGVKMLQVCACL